MRGSDRFNCIARPTPDTQCFEPQLRVPARLVSRKAAAIWVSECNQRCRGAADFAAGAASGNRLSGA